MLVAGDDARHQRVRTIINDYAERPLVRMWLKIALYTAFVATTVLGTLEIFTFEPCPAGAPPPTSSRRSAAIAPHLTLLPRGGIDPDADPSVRRRDRRARGAGMRAALRHPAKSELP